VNVLKKTAFVVLLAMVMLLAFSSAAFANFGPHGGYAADTDACAGCHRAHTSFSDVQWTDTDGWQHDALLVSSAKTAARWVAVSRT
jgi:hypothetical protein